MAPTCGARRCTAKPEGARARLARRLPTMRTQMLGLPLPVRLRLIDAASSELVVAAPAAERRSECGFPACVAGKRQPATARRANGNVLPMD